MEDIPTVMLFLNSWPNFLEDMEEKLPDYENVDSVVASLVGRSSMMEENILNDGADKKVGFSVKKANDEANLDLRAGVYRTYVSQSLL
ncbi:hypothetical protein NDU88_002598 [Pleurodeles waltl]|uniref:Uncharacterized protein n=1 Tax=Pleurodeles waltl TaxID=8319 RepID=A0AAV7NE66_PLEWA|nr:hypothetical protein NDU88_002552 [Pleurodeles waltl]KAJ1114360.1 hypothetical protein NDU88_002598 [Pleurodeles waltl]